MSILKGNFQLANPTIRIKTAFHNIKCLPDGRTASDPYQFDVGISGQHRDADIKVISEWYI